MVLVYAYRRIRKGYSRLALKSGYLSVPYDKRVQADENCKIVC